MQLREIMSTGVVTIDPTEMASAARSRMKRRRIRHLVVTENAGIVGILSERDLGGPLVRGRTVRDLMTPDVVSAGPQTTLAEAADLMLKRLIGCLPVLEDGRLVGIVTATDVLDELGRESHSRPETPGSRQRAPFRAVLPKALKPITGRAKAPLIPAHIRVVGVRLSEDSRADIRRKLGRKLGKFAASIERVSVRVKDVNGPRGGVDQLCRIKVVLSELPSVVFNNQDASAEVAIDGAIAGAERAVRKALQRRRLKPVKAGRARAPVQTG
ncbi:MAG TPA: CBS domain-containing protein [Clostridia bacterium]|nr:CBS domain-containing protein [Clostridia bacterium]